ncbi:MAG: cell division protein FtsL [Paracoccus sp. (in: a-proteobacteria)]|nr:cell division protein FtsL [Paracoccus sp. (in: a-proteobacteria)]
MRSVLFVFSAIVVMMLAVWAYRENYRTQAAMNEMVAVQREMSSLRDDLTALRAEWAYLNRPERLRELVNLNFERLQLVAINADQFIDIDKIAFPPPRPVSPPRRPEGFVPPGEAQITDDDLTGQDASEQSAAPSADDEENAP